MTSWKDKIDYMERHMDNQERLVTMGIVPNNMSAHKPY